MTAGPHDLGRDRRRAIILLAAALLVELGYIFFVSAGLMTHWPVYLTFLNDLAEGFRQGHLHLAVEPPAALLAQANPYSPLYRGLWYWDASLYHGHYYLYWGPLPALLLAAVKIVFRIRTTVGDQHVVFWLTTLQLAAGAALIERMGRRLFARPSLTIEVAAILVLGFANPSPYDLARGAVYEAAIVGGHAFLLLGLVFAFDAVADAATRVRVGCLAAAGAAWAGALACRISIAPATAVLVLVTAWGVAAGGPGRSGRPEQWRRLARAALACGAPLALGVGLLLAYNRARFDGWFDFGRDRQLNWINFLAAPRFVWPNLYAYLLRPPLWSGRFPFAYALLDYGPRAFPDGFHFPPGYFIYEQVVGVVRGLPWSWWTPVAVLGAVHAAWRRRRAADIPAAGSPDPAERARTWMVVALALASTVPLLPALIFPTATNRYLGDVAGALVVWGTLGAHVAHAAAQRRRGLRVLVVGVAVALAAVSLLVGAALGFKGQYVHFQAQNPKLYDALVRHLSFGSPAPPEPK